jgi:APA family basic amino acid/polyamine antiporter
LAFAYSFWMIYGAGEEYIAQGFLLLMAGIPVYVFMRWRQSKASPFDALPETPEPPLRRLEEERPLAPLGR